MVCAMQPNMDAHLLQPRRRLGRVKSERQIAGELRRPLMSERATDDDDSIVTPSSVDVVLADATVPSTPTPSPVPVPCPVGPKLTLNAAAAMLLGSTVFALPAGDKFDSNGRAAGPAHLYECAKDDEVDRVYSVRSGQPLE